ncbi:MAG: GNAT family N-acetyltransferase [Duncaniella sp.]|uniref:GNAT family N-acetyltransferase n=1 Tax=Duncaniella sp. TaxID=2518496 RepID=UPI0023BE9578|nr:N-acetyltransferase [Duncaniella sp.]MDE5988778.1 GNAT family N-acetyltransferase [Duncaniella sp.]
MKIAKAKKSDAPLIARSIMDAVGMEICENLAGENKTLADVEHLFTLLAEREDSQYSYRNTLVAVDDEGKSVGVIVSYDGALLDELRKPFFELVKTILDKNLDDVDDETDAEEFYLDTLAVLPEYRGQGIAGMLLKGAVGRAAECGKPAGLLVDKDNHQARRLYERVGFRAVGERPFCYVMMDHMQFVGE